MTPPLHVHPDREVFDRLATAWPLVPVWAEVLADVGTPVGLVPAIAGDGPGVLFESVERSERWGRYSFVAGDPAAVLIADDDGVHLRDVARDLPTGAVAPPHAPRGAPRGRERAARAAIRRAPADHRRPDGLCELRGGDLLDGHPAPHPHDAPVPPIALLVIDRAVVFDHWRQRLVLVVHAQRDGYDRAVGSLEELAAKVAAAPALPLLAATDEAPSGGVANMDDEAYRGMVASFKEHILAGDIFQGVPSRRVTFPAPDGGLPIYRQLRVRTPRRTCSTCGCWGWSSPVPRRSRSSAYKGGG